MPPDFETISNVGYCGLDGLDPIFEHAELVQLMLAVMEHSCILRDGGFAFEHVGTSLGTFSWFG